MITQGVCSLCQEERTAEDLASGHVLHGPLVTLARERRPDWNPDEPVCTRCLAELRARYVEQVIESERGDVSALEAEVVESLRSQELLTRNIDAERDRELRFGERLADRVAAFGGSWRFLILFGMALAGWIALNLRSAQRHVFDPYPFILLNLVLSCLAAVQAPIIMMSQNRQEAKDRARAENDYRINLKAELEIRHLHAKLDQLQTRQWERLLEIQRIQVELIEELARRR